MARPVHTGGGELVLDRVEQLRAAGHQFHFPLTPIMAGPSRKKRFGVHVVIGDLGLHRAVGAPEPVHDAPGAQPGHRDEFPAAQVHGEPPHQGLGRRVTRTEWLLQLPAGVGVVQGKFQVPSVVFAARTAAQRDAVPGQHQVGCIEVLGLEQVLHRLIYTAHAAQVLQWRGQLWPGDIKFPFSLHTMGGVHTEL